MLRPQLTQRYEILRTCRTTPIYREVEARDLRRPRVVRLWLIEDRLIGDAATANRLLDGVRAWMDAPAPGGVRVLGAGVVGGTAYLRVAPRDATCLRTRLLSWRPSLADVTALLAQLTRVMAQAHERCWLHGFLTARDVLVGAGGSADVEVAGLGLWGVLDRRALVAALGHERGVLAPEVRAGQQPGLAADLYGVAAIAVELVEAAASLPLAALRRRGWNPMLVETLDRLLAHGVAARPGSLSGLATALAVRAPAPRALTPPPVMGLASVADVSDDAYTDRHGATRSDQPADRSSARVPASARVPDGPARPLRPAPRASTMPAEVPPPDDQVPTPPRAQPAHVPAPPRATAPPPSLSLSPPGLARVAPPPLRTAGPPPPMPTPRPAPAPRRALPRGSRPPVFEEAGPDERTARPELAAGRGLPPPPRRTAPPSAAGASSRARPPLAPPLPPPPLPRSRAVALPGIPPPLPPPPAPPPAPPLPAAVRPRAQSVPGSRAVSHPRLVRRSR